MPSCSLYPSYIAPVLGSVPEELRALPQWVAWKAVPNPKKGKPDKIPMSPKTGRGASSTNSTTWASFDEAARFYAEWQGKEHSHQSGKGTLTGPIAGVGLVLTANDPLAGVDLDDCIAQDGTVEPWAQEIVDTLSSYTEISPSRTGIRIFVKGELPGTKCRKGPIEMYETGRYLTVTGTPLPGKALLPIADAQSGLDAVYSRFLVEPEQEKKPEFSPSYNNQILSAGDGGLLAKIRASKNTNKFNTLMDGNITGYPSQSEADLALCAILAFWTGKNAEQMDRLFRSSGLYRPKWDERHGAQTYGAMTIGKAISLTTDVYQSGPQDAREEAHDYSPGCFLPPPPPVPLNAFPPAVESLLKEAATAFGVPLEIPAASFLAFISCLVGRSRLISIKPGWQEAGNLWLAIVAKSGMGKSPCMTSFFAPVHQREAAAKRKFDKEFADYLIAEKIYQDRLKKYTSAQANPQAPQPAPPQPPRKPKWKQAVADDITPEALGILLESNPKGVLWLTDEMASLLLNLDRYTSRDGGTKSRLLSAHNCGPWKTNRASKPERNIYIPKACVGIFGGVQPGVLATLFRGGKGGLDEESGFLPRFIFIRALADQPSYFSQQTLSSQSQQLLDDITSALWGWDISFDASGNEIEKVAPVSDPAKALYVPWHNAIAEEAHLSSSAAMLKKLQAHALRLCLLLHCLDATLAGTDGLTPVTEDTMRRALLLADWIKEHQQQCWPLFARGSKLRQADPLETAIMHVIVENAAIIAANGGQITNTKLCALVKKKMGLSQVSNEKIGKAAIGLGLLNCKAGGSRAKHVPDEVLESFRATVQTVQAVLNNTAANSFEQDGLIGEPSTTVHVGTFGLSEEDLTQAGITTTLSAEELYASLPEHIVQGLDSMWKNISSGFY